jgi:hypothetical protein
VLRVFSVAYYSSYSAFFRILTWAPFYGLRFEGVSEYAMSWYRYVRQPGLFESWSSYYEFSFANFISSASGLSILTLFIIFIIGTVYYCVKTSKKLGTWVWF